MNLFDPFDVSATALPLQEKFVSQPMLSIDLDKISPVGTPPFRPQIEPTSEQPFPIHHFSQQIEPYALLLYINDSFQTKVFLPDLVGLYTENDGGGRFQIKPLEGFTAVYPKSKDRPRKGPIIARGSASFKDLRVDVSAGHDIVNSFPGFPFPGSPFPGGPFPDGPFVPVYPRGMVEFWAVWLFPLWLDPGPFSFTIKPNQTYELVVRTGEVYQPQENVISEVRGEVFVSDFMGSSYPQPVSFSMRKPDSIVSTTFSGTNPTKLNAHNDRALDWHRELIRPPWPRQTATLSSHGTQSLFPLQHTVYSFLATGNYHRYGVTYIDYIRVNNGNGSAFAYLQTAPKLLF